jgi:alanyl-tRNA synthetase
MNSAELREKYLEFFKEKGHAIIPSASLIPENDPTVLFTTAGMHPLVPYLLGEKHPEGKRIASCQKCIRTADINEVGDDVHLTFFEMLGNWSLGDYWKEEAIKWSFEFLTKELKLPLDRFAFTCFEGDKDAPKDEESAKIWQGLGVPKNRIYFLPKKDNWWGPAGQTGPCGPDTEMFYWTGEGESPDLITGDNKEGWVEIWNDVFMQYIKDENGNYIEAKQKNIDTGMGLERTLAVLNGKETVYKTDLFEQIILKIRELSGKTCHKDKPCTAEDKKAIRIIADHLKAATFIMGDSKGVAPSNIGQGYIVRRLIRRAIRFGKQLGIQKELWTKEIAKVVANDYKNVYNEITDNLNFIVSNLDAEEEKFAKTLECGLKQFECLDCNKNETISGKGAFLLYQTYGFPIEMTEEIAKERGLKVDLKGFSEEMKKHQELSRTASAGTFKGGLADASFETTKLHTTAHLMLAGLRKVLGEHISQKGSNITAERLRFDFSHKEKLTPEQIKQVENFVNQAIKDDLKIEYQEMLLEKAKEINATGVFESKYGEKVKVYFIGQGAKNISKEICGGPHVERTGILGKFKIIKEESSSAGVRRIKAILE